MTEVIPFEKDLVKSFLDLNITSWRSRQNDAVRNASEEERHSLITECNHYIDAYQSVRVSLFGELLAHPDIGDPMQEVADEWMGGEKDATIPLKDAGTIGDPNR